MQYNPSLRNGPLFFLHLLSEGWRCLRMRSKFGGISKPNKKEFKKANKVFRGRSGATIFPVTTLNEDIKRTRENDTTFILSDTTNITCQPAKPLYEGKKQKALVKDFKTSCKFGLFQMINMDLVSL